MCTLFHSTLDTSTQQLHWTKPYLVLVVKEQFFTRGNSPFRINTNAMITCYELSKATWLKNNEGSNDDIHNKSDEVKMNNKKIIKKANSEQEQIITRNKDNARITIRLVRVICEFYFVA